MSQVIIYPNEDGGVTVCYPCECSITVNEIARKDVPAGKPYLILVWDSVPQDHTFFNAFEADFSEPHGYGIGQQAWFIEQYQTELATLNPEVDQDRISELNRQIAVQQAEMQ